MRKFVIELTEDVCDNLVEAYKNHLTSDGGVSPEEVKDYSIIDVLNYAIYAHSDMSTGIIVNPNFKEVKDD